MSSLSTSTSSSRHHHHPQSQYPNGDPPGVRNLITTATNGMNKQKNLVVQRPAVTLRTASSISSTIGNKNDAPALKRYEPSVLVPNDSKSIHASHLPYHNYYGSNTGSHSRVTRGKGLPKPLPKALPRMIKDPDDNHRSTYRSSDPSVISLVNPYIDYEEKDYDDDNHDEYHIHSNNRDSDTNKYPSKPIESLPSIQRPPRNTVTTSENNKLDGIYSKSSSNHEPQAGSRLKQSLADDDQKTKRAPEEGNNDRTTNQSSSPVDTYPLLLFDPCNENIKKPNPGSNSISSANDLANYISKTKEEANDYEANEAFMSGSAIYSVVSERLPPVSFPDDSYQNSIATSSSSTGAHNTANIPIGTDPDSICNHVESVLVPKQQQQQQQLESYNSFVTVSAATSYYSTAMESTMLLESFASTSESVLSLSSMPPLPPTHSGWNGTENHHSAETVDIKAVIPPLPSTHSGWNGTENHHTAETVDIQAVITPLPSPHSGWNGTENHHTAETVDNQAVMSPLPSPPAAWNGTENHDTVVTVDNQAVVTMATSVASNPIVISPEDVEPSSTNVRNMLLPEHLSPKQGTKKSFTKQTSEPILLMTGGRNKLPPRDPSVVASRSLIVASNNKCCTNDGTIVRPPKLPDPSVLSIGMIPDDCNGTIVRPPKLPDPSVISTQLPVESSVCSTNSLPDPSIIISGSTTFSTVSSDLLLPAENKNQHVRDPSVAAASGISNTSASTVQTFENYNDEFRQQRDPSIDSSSGNTNPTITIGSSVSSRVWKSYMDPTLTIDETTSSVAPYKTNDVANNRNLNNNDGTESSYSHFYDDDVPTSEKQKVIGPSIHSLPESPSHSASKSKNINLVRKKTDENSTSSSNVPIVPGNGVSDYFQQSIIEEYNYLMEVEQRDSSVMSLPMVPAVLDDATTIIPVSRDHLSRIVAREQLPQNGTTNRNGNCSIYETSVTTAGTDDAVYGDYPNGPNQRTQRAPSFNNRPPPVKPARQLPISQLTKLRQEHGFPVGFVMEMARFQKTACTFFVCDVNNVEDQCVLDCAKLSSAIESQIIFCLGNSSDTKEIIFPPQVSDPRMNDVQRQNAIAVALHASVKTIRSPTWLSQAPLSRTIKKLTELSDRIPSLEYWRSEKISVVLATNRTFGYKGEPEFGSFVTVIKALIKLNVQIVIRLSTVDDVVVTYYNSLKEAYPTISLVFTYEITKIMVQRYNPWLIYGEPFHRLLELGYTFHPVLDILGQRRMNLDEVRTFFIEFYGKKAMMYSPDLYTEFDQFYHYVESINQREGKHRLGINPKNKDQLDYWIDIRKFNKLYNTTRGGFLFRPFRSSKSKPRDIDPCLRVDI